MQTTPIIVSDPLTTFLYVLLRDHAPLGLIEEIMSEHIETGLPTQSTAEYSSPYLALLAADIADRLRNRTEFLAREFKIEGRPRFEASISPRK